MLNLFYDEPDQDRWVRFDHYPRRLFRHLVRGKPQVGGQRRVFLNLCAGLARIGVPFRVNDYRHAMRHPEKVACIIGKPFILDRTIWENPIVFGPAVYSHPLDDPNLLKRLPVKKVLVPGPWMQTMCEPAWGSTVTAWPVGIDTERWSASAPDSKKFDILLYDKVRWEHEHYATSLIEPIRTMLVKNGLSIREIRYGHYREEEFKIALDECRAMIFLCEHETQGIAYQQALSCDVPLLAWDRGGFWQDPAYYPEKVWFEPVTSVPYWDGRCGIRFSNLDNFDSLWRIFWDGVNDRRFSPREFILQNLTLEAKARQYVEIVESVEASVCR